jgi:hypothetical protein
MQARRLQTSRYTCKNICGVQMHAKGKLESWLVVSEKKIVAIFSQKNVAGGSSLLDTQRAD